VPSTATSLAAVGLEPGGCVPWGTPVPETSTGVYIVSLPTTGCPGAIDHVRASAPLSDAALAELMAVCPDLTLDGQLRPTRKQLAQRIGSYWLADECVLYIGLAGQPLRTRVRQYYTTPLGAAKPHKGGWWLKTLAVLGELHVHFAVTNDFNDAEEDMMRTFAAAVSDTSRAALPAGEPVMPFANLRDGDWRRRGHGISGATTRTSASGGHRAKLAAAGSARPARAAPAPTSATAAPASRAGSSQPAITPHYRSQNITAKDIEVGQVRIPRGATKTILPYDRQDVTVVLRGRDLGERRWDPRYGPPERSGVVRVGKDAARELLTAGDVLAVTVDAAGVVSLG
jgi:hypothetical protein